MHLSARSRLLCTLLLGFMLVTISPFLGAESNAYQGFLLKDMAGNKHDLAHYQGKWVFVNYWATWCPPCLEEVPDLVNFYDQRRKKEVMVIGVVWDYKSTQEVRDYVDDMLISYPIVLGDDSVARQIGAASVMPTTFIYNPKGVLVKIKRGLVTKTYLEQTIATEKTK